MKLLITSVGSLLGQNILDSIESRRNLIKVVGTNSIAENPRNFRCNTVYLVHKTSSDRFFEDFKTIVEKEKPDFFLPGRDEDCIFLSDFEGNHPEEFSKKIPFGSSIIPRMMLDKYQTHLFCKKNHLSCADTFLYADENDRTGLNVFIDKHGFPLVVKPRKGFASKGVYFVLNNDQVVEFTKDGEVFFQEYLGNPERIFKYKNLFKKGIPLFFQIPEKEQYAAQTIISPDGTIGEVFFTIVTMIHGRPEYCRQIFNKDVEELVHQFSKIFYENGWYGPTNFQLKPDRNGEWKVFELSPRLTGTSSGRALLGYDEFGILANIFIPEFEIPDLSKKEKVKGHVFKYLHDNMLLDKDVELLRTNKVWKKF
jgi:carbamoyl-phosphate synthase large subunit